MPYWKFHFRIFLNDSFNNKNNIFKNNCPSCNLLHEKLHLKSNIGLLFYENNKKYEYTNSYFYAKYFI